MWNKCIGPRVTLGKKLSFYYSFLSNIILFFFSREKEKRRDFVLLVSLCKRRNLEDLIFVSISHGRELEKKPESATKNAKKVNLLDHNAIKHLLDESVSEIVTTGGYKEDVRLSNVKFLLGGIIIVVALVAQFYNKKFPQNRDFLICCIGLYVVLTAVMQLILYIKEKNAILFTYPLEVLFGCECDWFCLHRFYDM
ncbi:PREDICTED: probable signal peptidase complex subunit 2 [Camelina sativa]|uniref:Signal peptidase complex subunit 2 n=1 Tax=Camelina sativa TaxID=90675 RepID=A0ABM0Y5S0_CAMSA|nr:PREDICTED: probable signal peptidase complex subunit 2 [Camelina sativa]